MEICKAIKFSSRINKQNDSIPFTMEIYQRAKINHKRRKKKGKKKTHKK